MAEIIFYEKPGCLGNQQQKALLISQGHRLVVKDLLSEAWTEEMLQAFFAGKPVSEWFNLSAPRVKSGAVEIDRLSPEQALAMMLDEPLLIRRPLLQIEGVKQAGFVSGAVFDYLEIRMDPDKDLQTCPMDETESVCEVAP